MVPLHNCWHIGQLWPNWPMTLATTNDNTVVWTAFNSVYEELSVLSPSAIIEMFGLHKQHAAGCGDIIAGTQA